MVVIKFSTQQLLLTYGDGSYRWEAHDGPKKRGNALEVTNSHVCDGNLNATTITYLWGLITIQCVSVASLQELDVVTVVMRISTH
mmetsp:Transcript_2351/g.4385  ORF Transcript_2351/g.4385 Transcript_2351/m.4385 type:complete len:85 (+) Transcript_2351:173-427(+)